MHKFGDSAVVVGLNLKHAIHVEYVEVANWGKAHRGGKLVIFLIKSAGLFGWQIIIISHWENMWNLKNNVREAVCSCTTVKKGRPWWMSMQPTCKVEYFTVNQTF